MTVLPLFTAELLTIKGVPASPVCLSGWQGRKRICMLVKEEAGGTTAKSRAKPKLFPGALQAVKSSLIRVPLFFVKTIFITGMCNFLIFK